jgi:hypothetical protein
VPAFGKDWKSRASGYQEGNKWATKAKACYVQFYRVIKIIHTNFKQTLPKHTATMSYLSKMPCITYVFVSSNGGLHEVAKLNLISVYVG